MNKRAWIKTAFWSLALWPGVPCAADSTFTDLQITGQLGVGTNVPRARLDLQMSPMDLYGLRIVGPSGAPLFVMDKQGRTALGLGSAEARLDDRHGLMLRSGGAALDDGSNQMLFSAGNAPMSQFSVRTRHNPGHGATNAVDFYFSHNLARGMGRQTIRALSLEGTDAATACSVGVSPVGNAAFELDVSSGGGVPGGGTMRYRSAGEPTSKALLSGIRYLGREDSIRAYAAVKDLRHASFRFKTLTPSGYAEIPSSPRMLGLIHEDAPESLRGRDKTIVEDYRVLNLELAIKEINRKIAEIETKISAAERRGR